ncbi:hypothetical protein [Enterovibrio norvegicus]|uniref:hypothetical protein n=1 Tax=Enterovibrio norvegicus TaxID=188144 RepID=UPI00389B143C
MSLAILDLMESTIREFSSSISFTSLFISLLFLVYSIYQLSIHLKNLKILRLKNILNATPIITNGKKNKNEKYYGQDSIDQLIKIASSLEKESIKIDLYSLKDQAKTNLTETESIDIKIENILDEITSEIFRGIEEAKNNKVFDNNHLLDGVNILFDHINNTSMEISFSTKTEDIVKNKFNSIYSTMLFYKEHRATLPRCLISLTAAIYFLFISFQILTINKFVIIFLLALIAAISLDYYLVEYRMKKGYFGNNSFELKELSRFVNSHKNKNDFTDGNGSIKKLNDEVKEKDKEFSSNWIGLNS